MLTEICGISDLSIIAFASLSKSASPILSIVVTITLSLDVCMCVCFCLNICCQVLTFFKIKITWIQTHLVERRKSRSTP